MRKYALILILCLIAITGIHAEETLFAPGIVAIRAGGEGTPIPGISLKHYSVSGDGAFSLSTFELRAGYNTETEAFRFGPEGSGFDVGVRLSFPIYPHSDSGVQEWT